MSEIKKKSGLDQYGAEPFTPQQFGTAGVEWVNIQTLTHTQTAFEQLTRTAQPAELNRKVKRKTIILAMSMTG